MPPANHDCVTQVVTQDFLPEDAVRYLTKRGKTYYFRARIPFYIAKYFPSLIYDQDYARAEYVRSLRTDRRDIAKLRCGGLRLVIRSTRRTFLNNVATAGTMAPILNCFLTRKNHIHYYGERRHPATLH